VQVDGMSLLLMVEKESLEYIATYDLFISYIFLAIYSVEPFILVAIYISARHWRIFAKHWARKPCENRKNWVHTKFTVPKDE